MTAPRPAAPPGPPPASGPAQPEAATPLALAAEFESRAVISGQQATMTADPAYYEGGRDTFRACAAFVRELAPARDALAAEIASLREQLAAVTRDRDDVVALLDGCQRELGLAVDRKRQAASQRDHPF